MKRLRLPLVFFFLTAVALPGRGVKFGAYVGGFLPRDSFFQTIYGDDVDLTYGLEIDASLWRGFSLRLRAGHYQRNGETSFTGEISRLRLYPLTLGLRYTFLMKRVQPFLEAGYHHLVITETSAIGDIREQGGGYDLTAGVGFPLSARFSLEIAVHYTDVSISIAPEPIQMGGLAAGFAFLVFL
ncbi:MAG: outer membrane beta-barrel protein [Candidatus Aminicenantes bacterium]|nr:outer membrane beta-barrel protein [Candidatus Aminicenantes bacterium]